MILILGSPQLSWILSVYFWKTSKILSRAFCLAFRQVYTRRAKRAEEWRRRKQKSEKEEAWEKPLPAPTKKPPLGSAKKEGATGWKCTEGLFPKRRFRETREVWVHVVEFFSKYLKWDMSQQNS